ncbi:MAG: DUF4417 domain-containing protein [Bacilli bacterium]|nr:DUF4417 domain-containing protein [Bacilli bacterium]
MTKVRKGCKDVFNAFMLEGASFDIDDIPVCLTSREEIPNQLIAYDLTKSSTQYDSYVHFYIDDYKFDGKRGIWNYPEEAIERIKKYKGMITPDFSTNLDFPDPLKRYNIYRMRAFGCYASKCGINVINNVRWSDKSSYDYCFAGLPKNGIISIGTIGCIKEKKNWRLFQEGLDELVKRVSPRVILIYGRAPDKFFKKHRDAGIIIKTYESQTSLAFRGEKA